MKKRILFKIFNIIKKILSVSFLIFIVSFIVFLSQAVIENKEIRKKIEDFKAQAIVDEERSIEKVKYYKVSHGTYLKKDSFDEYGNVGTVGDILVKLKAPSGFEDLPFIEDFISYNVGGHAAIISNNDDFYKRVIETQGNSEFNNKVDYSYNDWMDLTRFQEFIGLRVKNATIEDYISASKWAESKINPDENFYNYNYNFLINRKNLFYCSDLVSRAYGYENEELRDKRFKLNYDGLPTTVLDLITSNDTYIFFYGFIDNNNVKHFYYMD